MKKILSAALALSLAVSMMTFGAGAVSPDFSVMPASQLAYMDVYSASPEAQQAILNARAEIIYGDQAWTVNGAVSVFDARTGKVEPLPEFSDVFPGWNLFEIQAAASNDPAIIASAVQLVAEGRYSDYIPPKASGIASGNNIIDFEDEGYFPLANDFAASAPFTSFTGNGNAVGIGAVTDPIDGARYNLGVSSGNTQIGWKPGLKVGDGITFVAAAGRNYSVRGSAYREDFTGHYLVHVTEDLSAFKRLFDIP